MQIRLTQYFFILSLAMILEHDARNNFSNPLKTQISNFDDVGPAGRPYATGTVSSLDCYLINQRF